VIAEVLDASEIKDAGRGAGTAAADQARSREDDDGVQQVIKPERARPKIGSGRRQRKQVEWRASRPSNRAGDARIPHQADTE